MEVETADGLFAALAPENRRQGRLVEEPERDLRLALREEGLLALLPIEKGPFWLAGASSVTNVPSLRVKEKEVACGTASTSISAPLSGTGT